MSTQTAELPYPAYLEPIKGELSPRYSFARKIGEGKNGITYLLRNRQIAIDVCLKTISPANNSKAEVERVLDTLQKEVSILRPLTHRCLPRIYEANFECERPYYMCTYHPGETWEGLRNAQHRFRLDETIFVVHSLIDTVEYLHNNGRTHCDLHQDNIIISRDVYAEGLMIIDFGSGHRRSDPEEGTFDRGHLPFKTLEGQTRHRHWVRRADAELDFEKYDFAALGRALWTMSPNLFADAPSDRIQEYSDFCGKLTGGHFESWAEVRAAFENVVNPRSLISPTDRLFLGSDGQRSVVNIPCNSHIPVGRGILAVVDSDVFQRLRHIRQLSFCEYQFPGGTHNRFEHSLGVFDVTRRCLEHLVRDRNFRNSFSSEHVEAALLAALVHDIGHYPFAHVVEHYVAARFQNNKELTSSIHHFGHTMEFLKGDTGLATEISQNWGEDALKEAMRILENKMGALSKLLDSTIDADKIDYLKRDSWHCGMAYGDAFNTDDLISSFTCDDSGDELLYRSDQLAAIEGFMILQDQMLGAVYWHERVRAVFAMFHRFLDGTVGTNPSELQDLVDRMKACTTENECIEKVFVPLLESRTIQTRDRGTREELEPLIRMHFRPNAKDIYRTFARFTVFDRVTRSSHSAYNVYDTLIHNPETRKATGQPIDWDGVRRLRTCFVEAFREKRANPGRFEVIVDIPWGKETPRVLKIYDPRSEKEFALPQISHLSSSLFERPTAFSAPIRVYVSPRLKEGYRANEDSIYRAALERFFKDDSPLESN